MSSHMRSQQHKDVPRSPVHLAPLAGPACLTLGVVLLALGVLGFVPGVTSPYRTLLEQQPQAMLADVFRVSILFNVINLVFGVAAITVGTTRRFHSRWLLGAAGVVYLVLWIYGFVPLPAAGVGVMPLNDADMWWFFGIGLAALAALFLSFGEVAKSASHSREPRDR